MVKKAFMAGCLGAGFAVMAVVSIVTRAPMDEPPAALAVSATALPTSQVDAYDLTLKAGNLPVQTVDDAI
jgi:hypothetical protein